MPEIFEALNLLWFLNDSLQVIEALKHIKEKLILSSQMKSNSGWRNAIVSALKS